MKRLKKKFEIDDQIKYKTMIETFVESYMYEPANYVPAEYMPPCPSDNIYIINDHHPSRLHLYNNGFDRKDAHIQMDQVGCSVDLGVCIGSGESNHPFMIAEGIIECKGCKNNVCLICAIEIEKKDCDSEMYCIGCYSEEKCIPTTRQYIQEHELTVTNEDMVVALQSLGMQVCTSNEMTEVNDIYDALIINRKATYNGLDLMQQILFPSQSSTYLKNFVSIGDFLLRDGGRYFSNNTLSTAQKLELTSLLTELTNTPITKNFDEDRAFPSHSTYY
jgi:hypothetical protein